MSRLFNRQFLAFLVWTIASRTGSGAVAAAIPNHPCPRWSRTESRLGTGLHLHHLQGGKGWKNKMRDKGPFDSPGLSRAQGPWHRPALPSLVAHAGGCVDGRPTGLPIKKL